MFDTTGLTEVKMKKRNGRQGSYYLDASGAVAAKTCSTCSDVHHASNFNKGSKRGLSASCRPCNQAYQAVYSSRLSEDGESTVNAARVRSISVENRNRTAEELQSDRRRLRADGTKRCRICHEHLEFSAFKDNHKNADGFHDSCAACVNSRNIRRNKKHWTSKGIPFDQCIYCQMMTDLTPGDLHGDHVVARAIGGPDEMSNIAPSCYACNICKGEDTLEKFLAEQFFYEEDRQEILDRLRQYGYVA